MPPRDHGESLKEVEEAAEERVGGERGRTGGERVGTALLNLKNEREEKERRKRRKVPVDGESKAENPKGSTRLAISLGR